MENDQDNEDSTGWKAQLCVYYILTPLHKYRIDGQSAVYRDKIHICNSNITLRQWAEQNYLGLLPLISNGKTQIIFKVNRATAEVVSRWFPSAAV
jgi:hypothetical protein